MGLPGSGIKPGSPALQADSLAAELPGKPHLFCIGVEPVRGFLGSSVSKESACNAGDPGLIPESGRCAGEGMGYPLQYSWASLVAQLLKNPPAMWEAWVQSRGWEDPLEKGWATHSSILELPGWLTRSN